MPHDAALYAESVKQRQTPAETADRIDDEVEDARAEYKEGAESSAEQYRYLTTGVMADQTPVLDSLTPPGVKAGTAGPVVITLHGSGFTATSKVNWDGSVVTPTFVNPTTLTVSITPPATVKAVPAFVVNGDLASKTKNYPFEAAVVAAKTESKPKPKPKAE
jgi:hypothetical protein